MEIIELGLYVLEDKYLEKYYFKDYPHNKLSGERPLLIQNIVPVDKSFIKGIPFKILKKHLK